MSWSVSAVGKAPAIAAALEEQFSKATCMEPEEGVRQSARATIAAALAAQDPGTVVKVVASGSQSTYAKLSNVMSIAIEPQYGFVE
jgi:hypothetical protein